MPSRPDPASLAGTPLFAALDRAALEEVVAISLPHRLAAGGTLFEQGLPATALHLILQGEAKVVQAAPDGSHTVLRFVGPGDVAGVYALLGPEQVYPASVVAVIDCVLLTWRGAALATLRTRHPPILANAMRAMGARAQDAHQRLHEIAAERVERRLALALLRLIRQAGTKEEGGALRIDFPLSRQDLAEMAGTTLHTASRILSGWEQAGILEGGRMRIAVRDPHALVRIAEG